MLEESEKIKTLSKFVPPRFDLIACVYLDKTESAWNETNLWATKTEGPIVVKQLLKITSEKKITSERKFSDISTKMDAIHKAVDSERHHPNVMDYYK